MHELGTLWTLVRGDRTARCALSASADECQGRVLVRVLIDEDTLLTATCGQHEVFSLAEKWRSRLTERGWRKTAASVRPRPDRRARATTTLR